jgi:hypothetical protein
MRSPYKKVSSQERASKIVTARENLQKEIFKKSRTLKNRGRYHGSILDRSRNSRGSLATWVYWQYWWTVNPPITGNRRNRGAD